jgi:hypothetical protein
MILVWAAVIGYGLLLWKTPVSDDTGFYGFVARAMAHGVVLHRDIPIATNSLGLYALAMLFRVFGSSVQLIRAVFLLGLGAVTAGVYLLVSRDRDRWTGLLAAIIAFAFMADPLLWFDFGGNWIMWALAWVVAGLLYRLLAAPGPRTEAIVGVALGLAALTRETFLVVAIGYCAYILLSDSYGPFRERIRPLFGSLAGLASALSVNAVLLTVYGVWSEYLRDMLQSGVAFRYGAGAVGLLSMDRISMNVAQLTTNNNDPAGLPSYFAVVALGAVSYLMPAETDTERLLKWWLVPALVVEAVLMNRTWPYHAVPLVMAFSVLTSITLVRLARLVRRILRPGHTTSSRAYTVIVTALVVLIVTVSFQHRGDVARGYEAGIDSAAAEPYWDARSIASSNEHSLRQLAVIRAIPHRSIAAVSQYPLLLLSPVAYPCRPFIEDLTAARNLNRPDLWKAQMAALRRGAPDLIALKSISAGPFSMHMDEADPDGLGPAIGGDRYKTVAAFGMALHAREILWDRIMIRKTLVDSYATVDRRDVQTAAPAVGAPAEHHDVNTTGLDVIVRMTAASGKMPEGAAISSGVSTVVWTAVETSTSDLYSFVRRDATFTVTAPTGTYRIDYLKPVPED